MKLLLHFLNRCASSIKPSNYYSVSSCRLQSFTSKLYYSTSSVTGIRDDDSLYRRLSPVGDWSESMVPILNQWVQEGRDVNKPALQLIIKQLRRYKRYKHALEVFFFCYFTICPIFIYRGGNVLFFFFPRNVVCLVK